MSISVYKGIYYKNESTNVVQVTNGCLIQFTPQTDILKSLFVKIKASATINIKIALIQLNSDNYPAVHENYLSANSSFSAYEYLDYIFSSNIVLASKSNVTLSTTATWVNVIPNNSSVSIGVPEGNYGILIYSPAVNKTLNTFSVLTSSSVVRKNDTNKISTIEDISVWTEHLNDYSVPLKPMICHNAGQVDNGSNPLDLGFIVGGGTSPKRGTNSSFFVYPETKILINNIKLSNATDEIVQAIINNIDSYNILADTLTIKDEDSIPSYYYEVNGDEGEFLIVYQDDWVLDNPRNNKMSEMQFFGFGYDEFIEFGYNPFGYLNGFTYQYGYGYGYGLGSTYFDIDQSYSELFGFDYHVNGRTNPIGYFADSFDVSGAYGYGFGYELVNFTDLSYPSRNLNVSMIRLDSQWVNSDSVVIKDFPYEEKSDFINDVAIHQNLVPNNNSSLGYPCYCFFDLMPYEENNDSEIKFKNRISELRDALGYCAFIRSDEIDVTNYSLEIPALPIYGYSTDYKHVYINYNNVEKTPMSYYEVSKEDIFEIGISSVYCASDLNDVDNTEYIKTITMVSDWTSDTWVVGSSTASIRGSTTGYLTGVTETIVEKTVYVLSYTISTINNGEVYATLGGFAGTQGKRRDSNGVISEEIKTLDSVANQEIIFTFNKGKADLNGQTGVTISNVSLKKRVTAQYSKSDINNSLFIKSTIHNRWTENSLNYNFISKKIMDGNVNKSFNYPPHLILSDVQPDIDKDHYYLVCDGISFVNGFYSNFRSELGFYYLGKMVVSNLIINNSSLFEYAINPLRNNSYENKLGSTSDENFCYQGFALTLYQDKDDLDTNEFFEYADPSSSSLTGIYRSDEYGFRNRKYLIRNVQDHHIILEGLILYHGSFQRTGDNVVHLNTDIPLTELQAKQSDNIYFVFNPFGLEITYEGSTQTSKTPVFNSNQKADPAKLIHINFLSLSGRNLTFNLEVFGGAVASVSLEEIMGGWTDDYEKANLNSYLLPFYIIQVPKIQPKPVGYAEEVIIGSVQDIYGEQHFDDFPDVFGYSTEGVSYIYLPGGYVYPSLGYGYSYPMGYVYEEKEFGYAILPNSKMIDSNGDGIYDEYESIGFSIGLPYFVSMDRLDDVFGTKWCTDKIYPLLGNLKIDDDSDVYVWENPVKRLKPSSEELKLIKPDYQLIDSRYYFDYNYDTYDLISSSDFIDDPRVSTDKANYVIMKPGTSITLRVGNDRPFDTIAFLATGDVAGGEIVLQVENNNPHSIILSDNISKDLNSINSSTAIKYITSRFKDDVPYKYTNLRKIKLTYNNSSNAEIKINNLCLHREMCLLGVCDYPYYAFSQRDNRGCIFPAGRDNFLIIDFNKEYDISYFEFQVRVTKALGTTVTTSANNDLKFNFYIKTNGETILFEGIRVTSSKVTFNLNSKVNSIIIVPTDKTDEYMIHKLKIRMRTSYMPFVDNAIALKYDSTEEYFSAFGYAFYDYQSTTLDTLNDTRYCPIGYCMDNGSGFSLFDRSTYNIYNSYVSRLILTVNVTSWTSNNTIFVDVVGSNNDYSSHDITVTENSIGTFSLTPEQTYLTTEFPSYKIGNCDGDTLIIYKVVKSKNGTSIVNLNVMENQRNWVGLVSVDVNNSNMRLETVFLVIKTCITDELATGTIPGTMISYTGKTVLTFYNNINASAFLNKNISFQRSLVLDFSPVQYKNIGVKLASSNSSFEILSMYALTPYMGTNNKPYDITPLNDMTWDLDVNYTELD